MLFMQEKNGKKINDQPQQVEAIYALHSFQGAAEERKEKERERCSYFWLGRMDKNNYSVCGEFPKRSEKLADG